MSYNVAWNTPGGFAIKGDDHLIHNNLLLGDSKFELFNMQRWASENKRTLVANNIVPRLSAGNNDRDPEKKGQPAELISVLKNNYLDDPAVVLRDPENLDFRPREGNLLVDGGYRIERDEVPWKQVDITGIDEIVGEEVDIGPYEYGSSVYWIPGFQFAQASTPVPPNGSTTVKPDADLIWLDGYGAAEHDVYFGTTETAIAEAGRESPEFRQTFEAPNNVFEPGVLEPGQTYYWRVDSIRAGEIVRGDVWYFTVQSDDQ
jgi:hypothetical protein